MRVFLFGGLILLVAFVLLTWGASGERQGQVGRTQTFSVKGMTCGGCSAAVKLSPKKLDGVLDGQVDHREGRAVVQYDPAKLNEEKIISAVEKAGFEAEVQSKSPLGSTI
ncbi:MAG: heavy-metal-associated domain-containing protein [Acidobacteria bacterium]|nr:heavy-metal-associated domain-containing protein [Acidobacteriota bacterium]